MGKCLPFCLGSEIKMQLVSEKQGTTQLLQGWLAKSVRSVLAVTAVSLVVGCGLDIQTEENDKPDTPDNGGNTPVLTSSIYVNPVDIDDSFIKGVDISTVQQVEQAGGKFYNEDGIEQDVFSILADHQVNWVRLRVWNDINDVYWSADVNGGQAVSGPIGGGNNDLATAIALAKRAKAEGLKVLLDFHYSDFWAHPGQQYMPKAWQSLSEAEVETALYNFTYDSLMAMHADGVFPDMVQIGNEINTGLVAPQGNGITSAGAIALLKQGIQAVRDAEVQANTSAEIMLHLTEPQKTDFIASVYAAFDNQQLDYDIIGLSYYPYWHGTLDQLQTVMDRLANERNKPVVIVETAYAFTTDAGPDGGSNIFGNADAEITGYQPSVLGQASFVRDLIERIADVPNDLGAGVFYWEPTWLGVSGAGWISGQTNGWENQAMFDYSGKVLDSLDVFWLVSETADMQPMAIDSVETVLLELDAGQTTITLPSEIRVVYNTAQFADMQVTWGDTSSIDASASADYQIEAFLADGSSITVPVSVLVKKQNVLLDSSFESGSYSQWILAGDSIFTISDDANAALTGQYTLNYWLDQDFKTTLTQNLTGLDNGKYLLSAAIMGESKGATASKIMVTSGTNTAEVALTTSGWLNWATFTTEVQVVNGQADIVLSLDEIAQSWGYIDDITFTPMF